MRILVIIGVFVLLAGVVTSEPAYTVDQTVDADGDRYLLPINGSYPDWSAFQFEINDHTGYAQVNMEVTAEGGYSFHTRSSALPWLRFPSTINNFEQSRQYRGREYRGAETETWYTVRINRTGPNQGHIQVIDNGDTVFEMTRTLDTALDEQFIPSGIKFGTTRYYEHGSMRNVKIWTQDQEASQTELKPAPDDAVLLVEPGWERVLQASTLGYPMRITANASMVDAWLTQYDDRPVYQIGEIAAAPENATVIEQEAVSEVFEPDDPVTAESREDLLYAGMYAHRTNRTLVFDGDAEQVTRTDVLESLPTTKRNHLVLADASMPVSALAPRYAVDHDAWLSVASSNRDERFSTAKVERFMDARDRGLGVTEAGLLSTDPDRAFKPFYITLVGTPFHNRSGLSDRPYFDQIGNNRTDLAGGRLPADLDETAMMLRNKRQGDNMTVATSYAYDVWYETLEKGAMTVRRAGNIRELLEEQGKQTKFIMEHRASVDDVVGGSEYFTTPAQLLPRVDPYAVDDTIESLTVDKLKADMVSGITALGKIPQVSPDAAPPKVIAGDMISTVSTIYKLNKRLQFLLEHRPAIDLTRLRQAATTAPSNADRQRLFFEGIFEPRPFLNQSELSSDHGGIVYLGRSSDRWTVPTEGDYRSGREPAMPETVGGLVFDGSGATIRSEIPERLITNGATGYLGYSSNVTRHAVADAAYEFYDTGFSTGEGMKGMFNDFHEHLTGFAGARYGHRLDFRRTVFNTPIYYGDPTQFTDPVPSSDTLPSMDCNDGHCSYRWSIDTDWKMVNETVVLQDVEQEQFMEVPDLFYHERELMLPADSSYEVAVDASTVAVPINSSRQQELEPYEIHADRLPDNRTKLIVRHLASRIDEDGITVFDAINITVTAEQTVSITDLATKTDQDGLNMSAQINGASGETAVITIANKTMQQRYTRSINASEEEITLRETVDPGRYEVSVAVAGTTPAGPVSTVATVPKPINQTIHVEAPEQVAIGDQFAVNVTVENHGRPTSRTIGLDLPDPLYHEFFTAETYTVGLDIGASRMVTIPLRAASVGNYTIQVPGMNRSTDVTATLPPYDNMDARLPDHVTLHQDTETVRYRDQKRAMSLSFTATGSVSQFKNKTGKITQQTEPGRVKTRIATQGGEYEQVLDRGEREQDMNGTIEPERIAGLRDALTTNEAQLQNIYYGATTPDAWSVNNQ